MVGLGKGMNLSWGGRNEIHFENFQNDFPPQSGAPRQSSGFTNRGYPYRFTNRGYHNGMYVQHEQPRYRNTQASYPKRGPRANNTNNHEPNRGVEHQPKHFVTDSQCTTCGDRSLKDSSSLSSPLPPLPPLPEQVICEKCHTSSQQAPEERDEEDGKWIRANYHGKRKHHPRKKTKGRNHYRRPHPNNVSTNPQGPPKPVQRQVDERPPTPPIRKEVVRCKDKRGLGYQTS